MSHYFEEMPDAVVHTEGSPLLETRYEQALMCAATWHREQTRKDGTPYLGHLLAVSALVMKHGGTESQAVAALLHDAVEDQGIELGVIGKLFGEDVRHIIAMVSEAKELPKRDRKRLYVQTIAAATNPGVQLVSAADKLDNLRLGVEAYAIYDEMLRLFVEIPWQLDEQQSLRHNGDLTAPPFRDAR